MSLFVMAFVVEHLGYVVQNMDLQRFVPLFLMARGGDVVPYFLTVQCAI